MFSFLEGVTLRLCQAIGAGDYATGWISRANNNNHYVLDIYYVPDIILFLMHDLN